SSKDDSKEGETPSTPRDTVADEPTTSAAVTANVQQPTTASPMLGRSRFPMTEASPSGGTQRIQGIPQGSMRNVLTNCPKAARIC
uniref:Gag protein n=1 Tax=Mesocestoides corti TaxID=53468 RepID=A0A5K3G1I9_MESCO